MLFSIFFCPLELPASSPTSLLNDATSWTRWELIYLMTFIDQVVKSSILSSGDFLMKLWAIFIFCLTAVWNCHFTVIIFAKERRQLRRLKWAYNFVMHLIIYGVFTKLFYGRNLWVFLNCILFCIKPWSCHTLVVCFPEACDHHCFL